MPIVKNREDRLHTINSRLNRWNNRPATTEELARLCNVAQSTIKQDIAYLKDVHEAPIEYSRKPNGYHYTRPFNLAASVTLTDKDLTALHTAVTTLNQLKHISLFADLRGTVDKIDKAVRFRTNPADDYGQYILFESVPYVKGSEFVEAFLGAIHTQRIVQFDHQRFDTEVTKPHRLFPYAIKEHRNRWYVVGWQIDYADIRVFGLDRVVDGSVHVTDDTFDAPAFDADVYFRQALGVAAYDNPPEDVVLSFTRQQGLHFKSQPFYPFRQEDILIDTDKEFRVKLSIIVNKELVYELARLGNGVKVISPPSLIDSLTTFLRQTLDRYDAT
jgi:predicted DNA-binding transcriptional regulator YafY